MSLPDLTFAGAHVLGPEGLHAAPLSIASGRIAADPVGPRVDLSGHI
jgi:hypothetical protein